MFKRNVENKMDVIKFPPKKWNQWWKKNYTDVTKKTSSIIGHLIRHYRLLLIITAEKDKKALKVNLHRAY